MKRVYELVNKLPKKIKDSICISLALVGVISTIMSILGVSLGNLTKSIPKGIIIVLVVFFILFILIIILLGKIFEDEVKLTINKSQICIMKGDIFSSIGWRVIGCDSHFDLRVDDVVIAKKSLHGKLVEEHAVKEELEQAISKEAKRRNISPNKDGVYTFPLGAIVPYESSVDGEKYLLLSMLNLNEQFEAHTNMAEYEQMLMKMWKEISRVYSMNDIVLPILGTGIPRFDDGPKDSNSLLRCMLCTLNSSGVCYKSKITVLLFNDKDIIDLYEYKDMFNSVKRRFN